ncbi:MAG: APC family permease [Candidatus Lindowbacteria bacterium]|nr:APC family permease [Candidatus Lindowbacteria bacterium]
MNVEAPKPPLARRLKTLIIGAARSPYDKALFHKVSLIALFAWVGLGADGISSSCYGPEEAFRALQGHTHLAFFVALASAFTIYTISASYSQIIELFPTGGGGYLVASKLLSPNVGMLSGCALLIDYVLTITISIASGADAVLSFLPPQWYRFKIELAIAGIILLILLNLRGVKESVVPLVPIFLTFIITHAFVIVYAIVLHSMDFSGIVSATRADVQRTTYEVGLAGMLVLIFRAYSIGAGTYTGIEAVSNGIPILREPRVQTAKRTMHYIAFSLAFMVVGLMIAYLLYRVEPQHGKTLNAILFESVTKNWGEVGKGFVLITLVSEATILFVAAQAGFLDGPRVLSYMALDRWVPTRFANLSDRFVTQNGVLIMGIAALAMILLSGGSVRFLVVLYSINVFITFTLSQLGMVRHWWQSRNEVQNWPKKLLINGVGLVLTTFILISVTVIKFNEGGWITLFITGTLIVLAILIKRHYDNTFKLLRKLDDLVMVADSSEPVLPAEAVNGAKQGPKFDARAKTAVVLVNGFNGLGLHTLFGVIRLFGEGFRNFVFVQVGVIDAGTFKGTADIEHLDKHTKTEVKRYVEFMQRNGYYAEGFTSIGNDAVEEITKIATRILERFPNAVFFGGQLVFPNDSFLTRVLHNYITFTIQRRLYRQGIPFIIVPVRV